MRRAIGPVGYTCPKIDEVIGNVQSALDTVKKAQLSCHDLEIVSFFDDIFSSLQNVEGMMEVLRTANSELRDWGTELAEQCAQLEKDVDYYSDKVNELEKELKDETLRADEAEQELQKQTA